MDAAAWAGAAVARFGALCRPAAGFEPAAGDDGAARAASDQVFDQQPSVVLGDLGAVLARERIDAGDALVVGHGHEQQAAAFEGDR